MHCGFDVAILLAPFAYHCGHHVTPIERQRQPLSYPVAFVHMHQSFLEVQNIEHLPEVICATERCSSHISVLHASTLILAALCEVTLRVGIDAGCKVYVVLSWHT